MLQLHWGIRGSTSCSPYIIFISGPTLHLNYHMIQSEVVIKVLQRHGWGKFRLIYVSWFDFQNWQLRKKCCWNFKNVIVCWNNSNNSMDIFPIKIWYKFYWCRCFDSNSKPLNSRKNVWREKDIVGLYRRFGRYA